MPAPFNPPCIAGKLGRSDSCTASFSFLMISSQYAGGRRRGMTVSLSSPWSSCTCTSSTSRNLQWRRGSAPSSLFSSPSSYLGWFWPSLSAPSTHHCLYAPYRAKSYNFYVNLNDPEETYSYAIEAKAKLEQEGRSSTTAFLHHELNEVLALYQCKNFIQAHKKAEELHEKALEHRKSTSLLFFTAKTASHCCCALADAYEEHLREKEERSRGVPTALTPSTSAVFQARRTIVKLREDAQRYQGIANRIKQKPEMSFLRAVQHKSEKKKEEENKDHKEEKAEKTSAGSSASSPDDAGLYKEEYPCGNTSGHFYSAGPQQGRQTAGGTSDHHRWRTSGPPFSSSAAPQEKGGPHQRYSVPACRWEETSAHAKVDEDFEPFFGPRHQTNRRRPAFRERTHHLTRQCMKRHVPK